MQQRSGSVWLSRRGLVGGCLGGVAGLLLILSPYGPAVRGIAAVALLLAGYASGVLAAYRRRGLRDLEYILRLREELRASQDHLMEGATYHSLGAYLEIVAHRMRDPLGKVVDGIRALARDPSLTDGARRAAEALRGEADVLHETLRPLAGYAMTKPGRAPFSVNTLLRRAVLLCRYRAEEKKIRFEERYAVIPPVFGPAERIGKALFNILVNALESMPYGGGTIVVETAHQDDKVVARVRDTGVGIRPEHLGRIFDPFFTTKPEKQGVGLGLWAARQSLDIIGADIRVSSAPHKGTEVCLAFQQAAPLRPGREGTTHPQELPVNTADETGRRIA
ncbi:MAG: sensor histidine kinase [Acidobacteriota bacterium]